MIWLIVFCLTMSTLQSLQSSIPDGYGFLSPFECFYRMLHCKRWAQQCHYMLCRHSLQNSHSPHRVVVHPQLPKAHTDEEVEGYSFQLRVVVQAYVHIHYYSNQEQVLNPNSICQSIVTTLCTSPHTPNPQRNKWKENAHSVQAKHLLHMLPQCWVSIQLGHAGKWWYRWFWSWRCRRERAWDQRWSWIQHRRACSDH